MSKNVNEYPDTLDSAIKVYKSVMEELIVDGKVNSVEEMIGNYSELIYPSMVLANEFFKFYEELMNEGE